MKKLVRVDRFPVDYQSGFAREYDSEESFLQDCEAALRSGYKGILPSLLEIELADDEYYLIEMDDDGFEDISFHKIEEISSKVIRKVR